MRVIVEIQREREGSDAGGAHRGNGVVANRQALGYRSARIKLHGRDIRPGLVGIDDGEGDLARGQVKLEKLRLPIGPTARRGKCQFARLVTGDLQQGGAFLLPAIGELDCEIVQPRFRNRHGELGVTLQIASGSSTRLDNICHGRLIAHEAIRPAGERIHFHHTTHCHTLSKAHDPSFGRSPRPAC